ncbi:MAG TPA: hypothetical protein VGP25_18460 [Gemmatimonadaceae bacterium]|nr:hypothetical protein [Gemmatimonadaceae bacterium]
MAERHDAVVYIDDAHGTGVHGPTGAGTSEHFGITSPRIIQPAQIDDVLDALATLLAR